MEKIKDIFGEKALTYEEFEQAVDKQGFKLTDLSEGGYVDRKKFDDATSDYKKQLAEANKQIETLKTKSDTSALQSQIEQLQTKNSQLESAHQDDVSKLDTLTKRELAASKTGIHDPDFLDLMQARFGALSVDEFTQSVSDYATANKAKWRTTSPSPDLTGEPQTQSATNKMRDIVMAAAGANYKNNER